MKDTQYRSEKILKPVPDKTLKLLLYTFDFKNIHVTNMAGRNQTSVCFAICVMFFICNECQSARINKRQSGNDEHYVPTEISDIIHMVGPEKQVDLGLILDVSKSISKELFYLRSSPIMSTFIRNFVTLHFDYTRLAVVLFDNTARIAINDISSNQGINKCQLFGGTSKSLWLQNITWSGIAGNAVKDALSLTKGILTTGRVNRPGVTQVTIVLTDGSYGSNDPSGAASELRDDGVTVFTAGLGNWLQTNNVRILGSKDTYFGKEDDWVMLSKGTPTYNPDVQEALGMVNNDLCSGTCNNGMCICHINTGITECQCQAGYTWDGANCIIVTDGTYKDTVGNHPATQCPGNMSTPTAGATSITDCSCPSQFLASECEDQCEPNPCTGGKNVCNRLADGVHECLCPRGYEGDDCNTNTDNCASMPCENWGTCLDLLDDYVCSCEFGFQGKDCEIDYDECQIGFCENIGVCTDEVPNNFQCTCDIGWKGRYCIDRNEDCDNCQNNGTCAVILDGNGRGLITCYCGGHYTGQFCESKLQMAVTNATVTHSAMSATEEPGTALSGTECPRCSGNGCTVDNVIYTGINCNISCNIYEPNSCIIQFEECTVLNNTVVCPCENEENATCSYDRCSEMDLPLCRNNGICFRIRIENENHSLKCLCEDGYRGFTCGTRILDTTDQTMPSQPYEPTTATTPESGPLEPFVQYVWPNYGPKAGGTIITIQGNHMELGRSVKFGDELFCTIIYRNSSIIKAVTPQLMSENEGVIGQSFLINLETATALVLSTKYVFVYKKNPEIESFSPTGTIRQGGTYLTVLGAYFDSVAVITMETTMVLKRLLSPDRYNKTRTVYTTMCTVINSTKLICLTPMIDIPLGFKVGSSNKKRDLHKHVNQKSHKEIKNNQIHGSVKKETPLNTKPRARRSVKIEFTNDGDILEFYIGFNLDGVDDYKNFSMIDVFVEPEFHLDQRVRKYVRGEPLKFQGEHLDVGITIYDYNITVGNANCGHVELFSNTLSCYPPFEKPSSLEENDKEHPRLKIQVGLHIELAAGYLSYPNDTLPLYAIILAAVIPVCAVVVIVVAVVVCVKKRKIIT